MDRNTIIDNRYSYNKEAINKKDMRNIGNVLRYVSLTNAIDIFDKNKVKGILNKLDINNKTIISEEIIKCIHNEDQIDEVFNEILDTLLLQVKYIEMYVYLINELYNLYQERMRKNIDKVVNLFKEHIQSGNNMLLNNYSIFMAVIVNYKLIDNINDVILYIVNNILENTSIDIKQ